MVFARKVKAEALSGVIFAITAAKPVMPPKQKLSGNLKKVNTNGHNKGTHSNHNETVDFVFHDAIISFGVKIKVKTLRIYSTHFLVFFL